MMISGGEKQRLAVSRLLLKDPLLLFFDEATSALDTHTERDLMVNINSILREKARTSVFIAHRLRTIYDADLIIVLREGRVAEQGTHSELIDHGGLYSELWSSEFLFLFLCVLSLRLFFSLLTYLLADLFPFSPVSISQSRLSLFLFSPFFFVFFLHFFLRTLD